MCGLSVPQFPLHAEYRSMEVSKSLMLQEGPTVLGDWPIVDPQGRNRLLWAHKPDYTLAPPLGSELRSLQALAESRSGSAGLPEPS